MLILARRVNQSIEIALQDGTRVTVVLTSMGASTARLGITAPKGVSVVRTEVYTPSANKAEK